MAQDNLNAYAQWLVQNKDKKGTPEFNKVAQAFQILQTAGPQQTAAPATPATPVNPEGTGVGRAIKRGAVQTAAALPTVLATADLRALTDVNRSPDAIRYDETLRAGVPNQAFTSRAASMSDPKKVNSMMQQYGVSPQGNINYQQVVEKRLENREDAAQNPAEYLKRLSANSETAGRLFKLADSFERSPTADAYAQSLSEAPDSFMGWLGTVTDDPLGFMAFMGETIAESVPQIAAGAATTAVTGNPVAGASVMSLGGLGREYANEVNSFLSKNGIDLSDPEATKKLFANKDLMDKANERGLTRGLVVAAADFAGQGLVAQKIIAKSLSRQTVAQGGSEAVGEALATQAVGDEFSAKDTIIEGLAGAGSTVGEATVSRTLFNKDGKLVDPASLSDTESQAAASLANRIRTIANQDGYNLKDVGSNGDAKQALEATHEQISGQIKEIVANPDVKKYLNPKQAATLDQLIDDYAAAQIAVRQSKNKVKSKVTQENFDAIMRLLPPTVEAQQIANLMREGNQLTDLFKNGTKGGISQFTDTFNPFTREDGTYDPSKVIAGMANKGIAMATKGGSLPFQFGAVGAGRAIDAVTGRRSVVNRFVNKFENKETLPDPVGPSLIAAERLKKEQDDARASELGGLPQVDKDNSPIGTILSGTGLDRDGLKAAMDEIQVVFPDVKALEDVFGDIRKNLDGGTNRIRNLNEIIPVINEHLNTPDTTVQRAAAPDQLLAQRGGVNIPNIDQTPAQNTPTPDVMSQAPQFGPQLTTQENYNRGIEANQAMNRELVEGVTTDPELNRVQRGRLITSLDVLANNLGSDPVAAAQEQVQKLEEVGVPQEAIDTYIQPYVDRVMQQQASRQFRPTGEGPLGLAAAQAAGVAPTSETQAPTQSSVEAPRKQLALPLFETPLAIEGKPTVRKIGEAMNQDHMDKVGRQLFPENSSEDYNQVFGFAEEELIEQLKQPNSGVGWYSKDVDESMRLASKVFPTLKDNQEHRQLYLTFAGIFSNGSDPDNAFIMSSWAFEDFLRTGKIPVNRAEGYYEQGLEPPKTTFKQTKTGKMITKDAGWGIRNQANEQQLGMLRYLVEREGSLKGAMDFLLTPQKRSDINDVMLKSGLYKDGRFKTQKEKAGPDEFGFLAFGKKLGRYSLGLHGVEVEAGDTTIDLWYTRTYRRWTGRLLETPIGKEGVAAQPANDTERDVIFKITGELAKKYDLPIGDVQALLWFFEKRTWGAQGLNTKEGTNSSGARKLLRERGIDPDAADDGTGGNGTDPQVGQSPKRTGFDAAPTGDAGILAQRMGQESGPREGRNTPPAKPSTQEVKLTSKPVKGAMSVGKPGTETENGIKDMKQLSYLAEAWDIALNIYDDHTQMLKDSGVDNGEGTTTYGVYDPKTRTASILRSGAKPIDGGALQTEFESFITTLHEVAHGIAESAPDGSRIKYVSSNVKAGFNFINKTPELAKIGSLEEKIMDVLSLPTASRNAIYKELSALQDKGRRVSGEGEELLVREYGRAMEILEESNDPALRRQWEGPVQGVYNYIRSTPEFAVDPMISYLHDPKKFKQQAPETAKMMREFFNKSGRLTLYAHPLPMAVATILAMLLKGGEEDEREKQQAAMMPPGALNQPMALGMLSQA